MIATTFLIFLNTSFTLTIIYAMLGFLTGGLFAVVFALSMDKTHPRIAATQFGIFMAALNIGELAGGSISGTLINIFDFNRAFLYGTWVLGPTIIIFYIIQKLNKK